VAFHVEITRSIHRARVFNLDEDALRRDVVEPWRRGEPLVVGDREWDRATSELTILEGPRLQPADLAHGQGWHHATRTARAVTADVLRAAARTRVAVLARGEEAERLATAALGELGAQAVAWSAARAAIAAGEAPGVDAALLLVDETSVLDAGLAVGALGRRAVVACVGVPRAELAGLDVVATEPGGAAALASRVRERLAEPAR
jgi:hypothetical protein